MSLWYTAVHEAGHAGVARALGRSVHKITIEPDGEAYGRCVSPPFAKSFDPDLAHFDARTRRRLEDEIMIMLGGQIAQARVDPDEARVLFGGAADLESATELARYASGDDDEADAYVEWLRHRAFRIVWNQVWWGAIESLASALLEVPTMNAAQARAALQGGIDAVLRKGLGA